jgi:hypothetical protein
MRKLSETKKTGIIASEVASIQARAQEEERRKQTTERVKADNKLTLEIEKRNVECA